MAQICPPQLFFLLSLVTSSGSFLSTSAHAQSRQNSIRSRHSRLWDVRNELINLLNRLKVDQTKDISQFRTSDVSLSSDCENDCGVLSIFSESANSPLSALKSGSSSRNSNRDVFRVSNNPVNKPLKFLDASDLELKLENVKADWTNDDHAFRYQTKLHSDSFKRSPRSRETKDESLENISWQSTFATDRPWIEESALEDLNSYSDLDDSEDNIERERLNRVLDKLSKQFSLEYALDSEPNKLPVISNIWASGNILPNDYPDSLYQIGNIKPKQVMYIKEVPQLSLGEPVKPEIITRKNSVSDLRRSRPMEESMTFLAKKRHLTQQIQSERNESPKWVEIEFYDQEGKTLSSPRLDNTPGVGSVSKRYTDPLNKNVFVYGHDDRMRVFLPQMRKFPFSNIVRLSTGCTGTLVTPRHVLTAAHCVHDGVDFRDNLEQLKIEILDTMGYKDYYAQKITIPKGWLSNSRSKVWNSQNGKRAVYDYAVVRLKLAVAGHSKFLPLVVPRPDVLQMDFHFLAFPEDDQQLWRTVCLASEHMALEDGNLIMTRCDSAVGNSGAAVFIKDPHGGLRVVGILSNTMHVAHHRSFYRYSIITALTWSKLKDICLQLGDLGLKYNVCPHDRFMRPAQDPPKVNFITVPFAAKRSRDLVRHHKVLL